MSEDGEKSKPNKQSKNEEDDDGGRGKKSGSETETENENEKENEKKSKDEENRKKKSNKKNARKTSKSESEYDERNTSELDRTDGKKPKTSITPARSHLYLIQQSSSFSRRTCHRPPTTDVNVRARKKLIIASVLCVVFIIVTVVGGVLSNSLAVAADAAHTLTDFAGFMISLFAIWLAGRKPTERLTFGWYRAEVLGALISVMTIWAVTAVLVWLAIQRCIHQDFDINAVIMMITAIFGIVTNVILGIVLSWGSSKTERLCDAEGNTRIGHRHRSWKKRLWMKLTRCGRKKDRQRSTVRMECQIDPSKHDSINVRSAVLHVVTDGLQSCGVLIAAIIIYFRPDWVIADPLCTFLFAALVFISTFRIMKDIGMVLMEATPKFVDYQEVQGILESIEGVKSVHNLRIWALNLNKIALSAHLVAYHSADTTVILRKAEAAIHRRYHLYETTIQIEEEHEDV